MPPIEMEELRVLVDTDILVYDTVENSPKHLEASALLDDADRIYLASVVMHEFIWLALRKLGLGVDVVKNKVAEYFNDARFFYVCENSEIFIEAMELLARDNAPPTKINDYLLLVFAKRLGVALATYDPELRGAAKRLGVKVYPP